MCAWCLVAKAFRAQRCHGSEDVFDWLHGESDLDGVFHIKELSWRLGVDSLDAPC
jgi:hypothetical protein